MSRAGVGSDAVPGRLPIHGFVLAGGQSSRMGQDKALLRLGGTALVALAAERLRSFCAEVNLVGNREDLREFAPVIPEDRVRAGPGAGMEAGLRAARQTWALFTPVDVPFVPAFLLRSWAEDVLGRDGAGCRASFLRVGGDRQPAFALVHREGSEALTAALDAGERRVGALLGAAVASLAVGQAEAVWVPDAVGFADGAGEREVGEWFRNLNTPEEFAAAQRFRLEA